VAPPALAQERVGRNKEEGRKVRFGLNPGGRTTDGAQIKDEKKSQETTTTKKKTPVIGRTYADVAKKMAEKVGVVSKNVQRVLLTL
jgi:hypothetical protein